MLFSLGGGEYLFFHFSFYCAYISTHTKSHASTMPGITLKVFGGWVGDFRGGGGQILFLPFIILLC